MRYYIDFNKVINMVTPPYIRGRKLILYLQALVSPLKQINIDFVNYAKETLIDASMTSQIFPFEWYLNRKFRKYFVDETSRIVIVNSKEIGRPLYKESANIQKDEHALVRRELETGDTLILYKSGETTTVNSASFIVYSPAIDTTIISEQLYASMLRYVIDKYRIANKTYIIKYKENERI